MRRQRPIQFPLAMMVATLGVVAAPSVNKAFASDGDPGADAAAPAAGSSTQSAAPPSTEPPTTEPPTTEPPTTEPPTTEPPTTEPPTTEPPTTEPPTTEPPTTEPPTTEPPTTEPPTTEPPTTEPVPPPETTVPAADPAPVPEPETPAPDVTTDPDPVNPSSPSVPAPAGPDNPAPVEGIDGITRDISFPVLGPVRYSNDFGACRDGCARRHEGNDLLGVRMQPLLAVVDGTITRIQTDAGISGNAISVTGADGWYYNYFHVNNDTPGTDDGNTEPEWVVSPGLKIGSHVKAGQVIGYMGDSGNAEGSVPHLHFEIRTPDRTPVNPYYSLVAAQERATCGIDEPAWTNTALGALSPKAVAVIPLSDGGRWVIDVDGRLHAEGPAAHIDPVVGVDCDIVALRAAGAPLAAPAVDKPAVDEPAVDEPATTPMAPAPTSGPLTPAPVADPEPEADAPAPTAVHEWLVQPGDSLWQIVQSAYGVSDDAAIAPLVNFVFESNRDQLTDPSVLNVGTTLRIPELRF
jgi:Peptidase family M23